MPKEGKSQILVDVSYHIESSGRHRVPAQTQRQPSFCVSVSKLFYIGQALGPFLFFFNKQPIRWDGNNSSFSSCSFFFFFSISLIKCIWFIVGFYIIFVRRVRIKIKNAESSSGIWQLIECFILLLSLKFNSKFLCLWI